MNADKQKMVAPSADGASGTALESQRCENCGRERLDVFWHREDRAWYCVDVFRCEARFEVIAQRGNEPDGRREDLSGVSF